MKSVLPVLLAALLCSASCPARAQDALDREAAIAEQLKEAMQTARWTGPMLASNAETLPEGHVYTEPYFFDVISAGDHHPGSSGFYQYGLLDNLTVGLQPNLATATNHPGRGTTIGDFKLLSQVRLTHFTPEHRVPTVALVLNEVLPTGSHDRLGPSEDGHGSGSFATEIGVNVQHYFLLANGRLLRGRINVLERFPHGADVAGRSVYGTGPGFRGRASPGRRTTLIGAVEYSLTNEWVLAFDVIWEGTRRTNIRGKYANEDFPVRRTIPESRYVGFAPAVEYNWDPATGILLGVWIIPKGHNTPRSVTPAIAISRFW